MIYISNFQNELCFTKQNGKRPVGRPRTIWTNYIEDLGWDRLELYPSKMMEMMEDHEVWRLNLQFLPRKPHGKAGNKGKRKEFIKIHLFH